MKKSILLLLFAWSLGHVCNVRPMWTVRHAGKQLLAQAAFGVRGGSSDAVRHAHTVWRARAVRARCSVGVRACYFGAQRVQRRHMYTGPDPHQVLGVSPKLSVKEVKECYLKLVRKWHPDYHPGDEAKARATIEMKKINNAWDRIKKLEESGQRSGHVGTGASKQRGSYDEYAHEQAEQARRERAERIRREQAYRYRWRLNKEERARIHKEVRERAEKIRRERVRARTRVVAARQQKTLFDTIYAFIGSCF